MKKITIGILLATMLAIYFIREGKKSSMNSDGRQDESLSMLDYFFKGLNSAFDEMTPKQTTSVLNLSNFCFRTIVK